MRRRLYAVSGTAGQLSDGRWRVRRQAEESIVYD